LPTIRQTVSKRSPQFWLLVIFLVLLFATGGSSRIDAQSLIILRPLSIIICALACMSLRRDHLKGRGWLLAFFGLVFLLAFIHVLPLPPSLWQSLPGRQDLLDVEKLAGQADIWRPLTISPMNGWHAIVSLFVPLAIFLLGVQLNKDDLFGLLLWLIALAALSGFIGLLQVIGDQHGALYFYRITNHGAAVGFFANRNHAATMLAALFPMLAVFASTATGTADQIRFRQLLAAAIGIVLIPLTLVTGSRSGLISSFIGLVAAILLYRRPPEGRMVRRGGSKKIKALPWLAGIAVLCLVFVTYFLSRAEAIERLFDETIWDEDGRTDFWHVSLDLFWKYFPWGAGSGSFVEAYQIVEPTWLLKSTYLNRAHNDWLEIAVTFGALGIIMLAVAMFGFIRRSFWLWRQDRNRRSVAFGRMASVTILMIAIASISDYPLRLPTMMGVFAIFALWFSEAGRDRKAFGLLRAGGI
jgi:O-antigen ligase